MKGIFYNWKVGRKLVTAFMLVAALMGVVGYIVVAACSARGR